MESLLATDSEGIHAIANTGSSAQADIVFVHGLGGSSHSTWRYGKDGEPGSFFWPAALGEDLPLYGIWSIGYPAGFTELGKPGMIIEKRAGNLSQKMANAGLGNRPLLFITHSMGGLVVKSLIVSSQTQADPDRKRLTKMLRGVVFCATPHKGSSFANAAVILGKFFCGGQAHVNEMKSNADELDFLHEKFIEWHRHNSIAILSYAENVKLFRKRWYLRPVPLGLVVPRASANPGIAGHSVIDVDDDHLSLVKPRDHQHDVYAGVLRWIEEQALATIKADDHAFESNLLLQHDPKSEISGLLEVAKQDYASNAFRLSESRIEQIVKVATTTGLASAERRPLLFAGIPNEFYLDLPEYSRPLDQLRSDIMQMNCVGVVSPSDEEPLVTWLKNAAKLIKSRPESTFILDLIGNYKG